MARRDADFVDEQLRRLVGMHIVHRRRHPDHVIGVDRDSEVVPRVTKELGGERGIDLVIEDAGGDARQQLRVVGRQHADFDIRRDLAGRQHLGTHLGVSGMN